MKLSRTAPLIHFPHRSAKIGFLDKLFIGKQTEEFQFNRRMFDQDFSRMFNYADRQEPDVFDIVTNDEGLTSSLLDSVDTRYSRHRVSDTIREWTNEIADDLIWVGKSFYYVENCPSSENIRVRSFGPNGVVTLLGFILQWVPSFEERHWDGDDEVMPREVRILDGSKVLEFKMPKLLRKILASQNRMLATLDRYRFTAADLLPKTTYDNPNPMQHFDFVNWRDAQTIALFRSTRATGWNGRDYDGSMRSDFFECHRAIRFRRNRLILRDSILKQLSSQLSKVGRSFNSKYSFEVAAGKKLLSVEQLNSLENRLSSEDVSFSEVIDTCYKS